jgi:hypothetical protein
MMVTIRAMCTRILKKYKIAKISFKASMEHTDRAKVAKKRESIVNQAIPIRARIAVIPLSLVE